jgi:hypothetical protein
LLERRVEQQQGGQLRLWDADQLLSVTNTLTFKPLLSPWLRAQDIKLTTLCGFLLLLIVLEGMRLLPGRGLHFAAVAMLRQA